MKKRNKKLMNNHGQITIFVIIGIILVVAIVLILFLRTKPSIQTIENSPEVYLESCVKEAVSDSLVILSKQGGDLTPKGSVMFNSTNLTYLCYTSEYYKPCINQRPLLIEHIESEIKSDISPKIDNCFNAMKLELEKKYNVQIANKGEIEVKLQPKKVVVNINRSVIIKKGDSTRSFTNFRVQITSPLYDLTKVANEIINQESQFCNFDEVGYMILYPSYDINKIVTGYEDIVYIIKERSSGKEFKFAVRGCIMPHGI
jgi:hypothetical protein